MKERPILFSASMVRAILEGRKTQTRRIAPIDRLKISHFPGDSVAWSISFSKPVKGVLGSHSGGKFTEDEARRIIASQFCPYGQPGDRLWVRETWVFCQGGPIYDAAGGLMDSMDDETRYRADRPNDKFTKWKPAIHMPRWASRITLEVTGVRVERLQDISTDDACAEGALVPPYTDQFAKVHAVKMFRSIWSGINGEELWDANPWVWVVEFQRVQGGV